MIRWAGFPAWADWTDINQFKISNQKSLQVRQSNDPIHYSNSILVFSFSNFQWKLVEVYANFSLAVFGENELKKRKAIQIKAAVSADF